MNPGTLGCGWRRATTHCPQGHAYTPANTYLKPSPFGGAPMRHCKECNRVAAREYQRRKRVAA